MNNQASNKRLVSRLKAANMRQCAENKVPWKTCTLHVATHVHMMSEVLLFLALLRPLPTHCAFLVSRGVDMSCVLLLLGLLSLRNLFRVPWSCRYSVTAERKALALP